MEENLSIGSIVLLMNNENNIYKAMIVKKGIVEDNEQYDYLAIPYPYGFVGVDSFTLVNEDNIFDVVYDADREDEMNASTICPSSVVISNQIKYLVIGKNVRQMGMEETNEYAVVKYEDAKAYDITYIAEEDIEEVVTYGFINQQYRDFDEDRAQKMSLAVRRFRAFIPIGSRVLIQVEERQIEVLIIARNVKDDQGEYSDYRGVNTEYGYIGNDYVFNFDKVHVIQIVTLGYFNHQEVDFNSAMLIERKIMDRS